MLIWGDVVLSKHSLSACDLWACWDRSSHLYAWGWPVRWKSICSQQSCTWEGRFFIRYKYHTPASDELMQTFERAKKGLINPYNHICLIWTKKNSSLEPNRREKDSFADTKTRAQIYLISFMRQDLYFMCDRWSRRADVLDSSWKSWPGRSELACSVAYFRWMAVYMQWGKKASSRAQGGHQPSPSFVSRADGAFRLISVTLLLPSS